MVARHVPQKRSAGRPLEYREQEFCEGIIIAGRSGMSLTAYAGSIGKCRDTLLSWAKKYPAFAAAKMMAEAAAAFYWENKLRVLADTGKGNVTAIIFALKNRVPLEWRDQITQKLEGSQDQPVVVTINLDELQKLGADQQAMLRTVLKTIATTGGIGVDMAAISPPKTQANPARYAELLRPDSATEGQA